MLRLMMQALAMDADTVPTSVRPAWKALITASAAQKAMSVEMRAMPKKSAATREAWKAHDARSSRVNAELITAFREYVAVLPT